MPREVTLRVECAPGATGDVEPSAGGDDDDDVGAGSLTFLSIDEPPESCRYTVVLGSARVCSHPRLSRSRTLSAQGAPQDIPCYGVPAAPRSPEDAVASAAVGSATGSEPASESASAASVSA